jgi:hypothetical protein
MSVLLAIMRCKDEPGEVSAGMMLITKICQLMFSVSMFVIESGGRRER